MRHIEHIIILRDPMSKKELMWKRSKIKIKGCAVSNRSSNPACRGCHCIDRRLVGTEQTAHVQQYRYVFLQFWHAYKIMWFGTWDTVRNPIHNFFSVGKVVQKHRLRSGWGQNEIQKLSHCHLSPTIRIVTLDKVCTHPIVKARIPYPLCIFEYVSTYPQA